MLSFEDRLDEESKAVLEMFPESLLDLSDIPAARAAVDGLMVAMFAAAPDVPGVETEDHWVRGAAGDPDVMVRVYTPSDVDGPVPGLYWIHGGGMVLGNVSMDDLNCKGVAAEAGCVVASVEYRLAPEHPHPAPIEDCYAGLRWFAQNSDGLGVDRSRIAIGGASAGGGLAAALALLARDRGEVEICFQQLIYPMLDDRNVTPSSHYVQHPKAWNREANIAGWTALLGKPAGSDDVSPYASPARAEDLSGSTARVHHRGRVGSVRGRGHRIRTTPHTRPAYPPSCTCFPEPSTAATSWCPHPTTASAGRRSEQQPYARLSTEAPLVS